MLVYPGRSTIRKLARSIQGIGRSEKGSRKLSKLYQTSIPTPDCYPSFCRAPFSFRVLDRSEIEAYLASVAIILVPLCVLLALLSTAFKF